MSGNPSVHRAGLLGWCLVWAGLMLPAHADVILDPAEVTRLLAVIGKNHADSTRAPTQAAQLDALYNMGERVMELTTLMNRDLEEHGFNDKSLVELILRRLKQYGVVVTPGPDGFHYDLGAFREYLRRAPAGKRAADARLALLGSQEPGDDLGEVEKAIAEKERFLRDYPRYSEISLVKYFLAGDHFHLGRIYAAQKNTQLSEQHQKIALDLYRQIVKLAPDSWEGQAAADYLSQLRPAR